MQPRLIVWARPLLSPPPRCLPAICSWLPSHLDLSVFPSEEVSVERDRLLVRFRRFATVCTTPHHQRAPALSDRVHHRIISACGP